MWIKGEAWERIHSVHPKWAHLVSLIPAAQGMEGAGHRVLAPCAPGSLSSQWIVVLSQVSNKCVKNIALLGMELPKSPIPS